MKSIKMAFTAAVFAVVSTASQAGIVNIWSDAYSPNTLNNFYNANGHTSSVLNGNLDSFNLNGVNLLWAMQPANDYTSAELDAMAAYLAQGGRIAFMGEHGSFMPAQNNRINTALAFLGATMHTVNNAVSCGFQTASRADGEILEHTLTAGVNNYEYACYSELSISGSAEALMYGNGLIGSVMMAYQNIGPGSVFFITDQNVWDHSPTWAGFDNTQMFLNLVTAETGAPPVGVPAPASLALIAVGLLALNRKKVL